MSKSGPKFITSATRSKEVVSTATVTLTSELKTYGTSGSNVLADVLALIVEALYGSHRRQQHVDAVQAVLASDPILSGELLVDDSDASLQYLFMSSLSRIPAHPSIRFCLPPKTRSSPSNTLVLDLDETLVHCSTDPLPNPDLTFEVEFDGVTYKVYALKRPGCDEFLSQLTRCFEVVVFTASLKVYADKLLTMLDPNHTIKHRVFRESCAFVNGNYIKDLNVLDRDLARTVIVDNAPQSFGLQIDNGIPILSWYDDISDKALPALLPFLCSLSTVDDVRPVLRHRYRMADRIATAVAADQKLGGDLV